ncbi:MAG: hypothetical protein ACTSRG_01635 [Candidatus Helarchaeota archaeon]
MAKEYRNNEHFDLNNGFGIISFMPHPVGMGGPPVKPPPHPPFFHAPFGYPLPPPPGLLPMTRQSFKEIKHFFILSILIDKPNGITGYQLQDKYNFPRGNLLRTMKELVENNQVATKETVIKNRAQKFYIITDKGVKYLKELKKKLASQFALMSNMAPPEIYANPFADEHSLQEIIEIIKNFETKNDALDFFRGIRSSLKLYQKKLKERIEEMEKIKTDMDTLIINIEKLKEFNIDRIKNLLKNIV